MERKATRRSGNIRRPKARLGLPDLDHSKTAVLSSLRSPESKRGYRHAIDEFIEWYCSEPRLSFNKVVVTRYRIHLEDRRTTDYLVDVKTAGIVSRTAQTRYRYHWGSRPRRVSPSGEDPRLYFSSFR